ncbi:hypothetical protein Hanom_Chr16g01459541 [Helianthus anomalus]
MRFLNRTCNLSKTKEIKRKLLNKRLCKQQIQHSNSSSFAIKPAQKGLVHPSGPARATQAAQNAIYMKR